MRTSLSALFKRPIEIGHITSDISVGLCKIKYFYFLNKTLTHCFRDHCCFVALGLYETCTFVSYNVMKTLFHYICYLLMYKASLPLEINRSKWGLSSLTLGWVRERITPHSAPPARTPLSPCQQRVFSQQRTHVALTSSWQLSTSFNFTWAS